MGRSQPGESGRSAFQTEGTAGVQDVNQNKRLGGSEEQQKGLLLQQIGELG